MVGELVIREVHSFLAEALHGRRRVLEVGCGNGAVARRLAASGFDVTAIDPELPPVHDPKVRFVKHDFLTFDAEPFDAVVFTASLHHIAPLSDVVAHTKRLVAPGGLVVADDFDIAAPDRETLRWYYETQELLAVAGCYDTERLDPPNADPVARWHAAHHHHLHTGQEMRQALAALGSFSGTRAPYLYRYISGGLPATAHGALVAAHVLATETARIADGSLCAVGLRVAVALP